MIQAKIVADSICPRKYRLTTLEVVMPRYILAEFNTHRMLSKNSASSRAIPFAKMVKMVEENPFIPIAWMKDHKGMQGTEYITDENSVNHANLVWKSGLHYAIEHATVLNTGIQISKHDGREADLGIRVTKQMCNRLLESYMWHKVLVSATEWENFFALRCPNYNWLSSEHKGGFRSRKDMLKRFKEEGLTGLPRIDLHLEWFKLNQGQADIHMMALAEAIWDAMNESTPKELQEGEWHIPYGNDIDESQFLELVGTSATEESKRFLHNITKVKIATARCAQTSYTIIGEDDKPMDYAKLVGLHDRLVKSGHWSPFEHCAKVMTEKEYHNYTHTNLLPNGVQVGTWGCCGNYRGFIQYRKMFDNENITI